MASNHQTELMNRYGLTAGQKRTVELIMRGYTNKQTAELMHVLEKTVKFHLGNVNKKLRVKSKPQLFAFLGERGWFSHTENLNLPFNKGL